jgi:hypothetical protein
MSDAQTQCSIPTNFETQTRVKGETQLIESVESILNLILSFYLLESH